MRAKRASTERWSQCICTGRLSYESIVNNIDISINSIPLIVYKNILKGTYEREENYIKKPKKEIKYKKYKN